MYLLVTKELDEQHRVVADVVDVESWAAAFAEARRRGPGVYAIVSELPADVPAVVNVPQEYWFEVRDKDPRQIQ